MDTNISGEKWKRRPWGGEGIGLQTPTYFLQEIMNVLLFLVVARSTALKQITFQGLEYILLS